MLRNFAANITGKRPGKHWPGRFLKQHNNDLICLYTTGMDAARVGADSAYEYNHEVCVEWWWEGLGDSAEDDDGSRYSDAVDFGLG